MNRIRSYPDAMGPVLRIGMLQHQEVIRVSRIGAFTVRGLDAASHGTVNADDGVLEFRLLGAIPARMGWRLVLAKEESPEAAARWIERQGPALRGIETDVLEMGFDFEPWADPVTAREWWVVSQAFHAEEEANAARAGQPRSALISLLPVRLTPPRGVVEIRMGNRPGIQIPQAARLEPSGAGPHRLILHDVIVGVGFHWQHLEDQKLRGALELRVDNPGRLTAINEVALEEYLYSVNSSEMMSQCPPALLEAQTIAARNTALATMGKHHFADDFDLCADDHCQCYRGSSRETDDSRRATLSTLGETLAFGRRVCDCRYSKMCGGVAEDSGSVWEGYEKPYMMAVWDGEDSVDAARLMPADTEERARAFIEARPDVYCNTLTAEDVPAYLRYSAKYFRWTVEFTRKEFEASLARFPQWNVGEFQGFEVLKRGKSGRIEYIRVIGSARSVVIGREYNIRLAFAPFFLYSSCFIPHVERDAAGRVSKVRFEGAGWGHGAGLCQIGASMMAERGKSCGEILSHYYRGARIARLFGRGADLQRILARERSAGDLRIGDRCYEYFNCYAAARCPVYQRKIALRARATGGKGDGVEFRQDSSAGAPLDLQSLGVDCCEFLNFTGETASLKSGVQ